MKRTQETKFYSDIKYTDSHFDYILSKLKGKHNMSTKVFSMFSDNVRETFHNMLFHRYNLMKRITNFKLYTFSWDSSKHVVDKRRVDLKNTKFKDIIKTNKVK